MTQALPTMDSKSWAHRWQGGCATAKDMVEGVHHEGRAGPSAGREQKFPHAETRQHQLIGLVIDTALVTAVYESIKWDHSKSDLERLLDLSDGKGKSKAIDSIMRDIRDIKTKTIQKRSTKKEENAAIMHYVVNTLQKGGYIKTHYAMVSDETWQRYQDARLGGDAAWTRYAIRHEEWQDGGRIGPAPEQPGIAANPDDPRRIACNELVKQWIEIPTCSTKTLESIERKQRNRKMENGDSAKIGAHLRDINRLMIVPDVPQTADDFFEILHHLHPPKQVENEIMARVQVEGWQVKRNAQFDRMAYVALTRLEDKKESRGAAGMVAEIKTVGSQMRIADSLTAPLQDARKELDDINKFQKNGSNPKRGEEVLAAQAQLRRILLRSKQRFEEQCDTVFGAGASPYVFPEIRKEDRWARPDTYDKLEQNLLNLCRDINVDALNREHGRREWPESFLYTAYLQQERSEAARGRLAPKPSKNADAKGAVSHTLDTPFLRRVGNGDGMDEHWRQAIRKRARADFLAEQAASSCGQAR